MIHPSNLPDWAIYLVAGLAKYDAEHPKLFARYAGSSEWQRADCPCKLQDLIPPEVRAYAAGWAAATCQQLAQAVPADAETP